jgi:hypothetical protein
VMWNHPAPSSMSLYIFWDEWEMCSIEGSGSCKVMLNRIPFSRTHERNCCSVSDESLAQICRKTSICCPYVSRFGLRPCG